MTNLIIGIHGLANKPKENTLTEWWDKSIKEGLEKNCNVHNPDYEFKMVYWANLLYKNPQHLDPDFNFDDLYINQPYYEADRKALKKYKNSWRDTLREKVGDVAGSALDQVRGYVGLDRIGEWLLERKLRNLHFYYDKNQNIRERRTPGREPQMKVARQVLMDELMNAIVPNKGRRMMLIAHSMGSIIAYDVLRTLGQDDRDFPVHHFITIGSPLGLGLVKENIYSERAYADVPVRTPTVVRERWVNYADRHDPVATDLHLDDDYGPNAAGLRVKDDLVMNDFETLGPKPESKPHKSFGYLRTPEISEHIRDFLKVT